MNTINETSMFKTWLDGLRDLNAKVRINTRIDRAKRGNFGDHRVLNDGISEMRINYGPGYRVYFAQEKNTVYLLLCGGDKSSQSRDILTAKTMWAAIKANKEEKK